MRSNTIKVGILSSILGILCFLIINLQGNDVMAMKHWMELLGVELIVQLLVHYIIKDEDIH